MTPRDDAELFWERHYGTRLAGGERANPLLVETVGPAGETVTVTDNVMLIRRTAADRSD